MKTSIHPHAYSPVNRTSSVAGALILVALWLAGYTQATVVNWTGAGGNGNWSNIGNWSVYPATGDSVVFGNSPQTNLRADFSSYPDTDPQRFNQPALHLESI